MKQQTIGNEATNPTTGIDSSRSSSSITAEWKSTDRIAEFVANVTGAIVVILGLTSYVITYLISLWDEIPKFRDFASQKIIRMIPKSVLCMVETLKKSGHSTFDLCGIQTFQSYEEFEAYVLNIPFNRVNLQLIGMMMFCLILFSMILRRTYKWIGWYCGLQLIVMFQWVVALYQMTRILLSMSIYFSVKMIYITMALWKKIQLFFVVNANTKRINALKRHMNHSCDSYAQWVQVAETIDQLEGKNEWKKNICSATTSTSTSTNTSTIIPPCDFYQLQQNIFALQRAIQSKNINEIQYFVAAFMMRDKLGIDSPSLHLECNHGTKQIIQEYNELLLQALHFLSIAPEETFSRQNKILFFSKMKQSFGATALCLSGGGALAMYHMGIIKALLDADLLPNVVSGSSGGSIIAAMIACKTNEELLQVIIQENISTRFLSIGIRWFPPLIQQLAHCIQTGFLLECSMFEKTTQHYYGEPFEQQQKMMYYTFQDAYLKTKRHVNITVSASDLTGNKGPKKLLLNHINTPHVLLWSAVAVSCSLPGIMKGKQLMAKNHEGKIVPYLSLGKEWIDGSMQHDLPMETMAACFNVTNFIVSQVNPHVVPFVGNEIDTPRIRNGFFYTLESIIAADVRHRLKMLAFLGLFPKIYGQQFNFKQNFVGNVTIVPKFIFAESIGIKAILNPTIQDMERYIKGGQRATWPKIAYIRHLCCIEKCLDLNLYQLLKETKTIPYTNWLHPDTARTFLNTKT
jgi:predicted acylesterase/phospholipase RssA